MIILASEGCFWPLTASMRSEVKKICQCLTLLNLEQLQYNKLFGRMYGLDVMEVMTMSGHPSIINKKISFDL